LETTTEAIVLRKVPYTGSSIVATAYTKRFGLLSFMIRTGSKKNRRGRAALELLSGVEIGFHYREKYNVQTAREIRFRPESTVLDSDPLKGSIRLFLAEMLYKAIKEEAPDPELFDYIDSSLQYFASAEHIYSFHLLFLMRLTRFFGFFPKGNRSADFPFFDGLSGEFTRDPNASLHTLGEPQSRFWSELVKSDYGDKTALKTEMKRELLRFMVDYYRLHLEGFGEVKSLPVLLEVFSS